MPMSWRASKANPSAAITSANPMLVQKKAGCGHILDVQ
jgi:hypothetical protein